MTYDWDEQVEMNEKIAKLDRECNDPDTIARKLAPKYTWTVTLEMQPVKVYIEADDAEEAMELAKQKGQIKEMPMDSVPELEPVTAKITGVTPAFESVMNDYKERNKEGHYLI